MNKVILMGTPTRDPEVRYTQEAEPKAVARINLAVDRVKADAAPNSNAADFISCIAFGNVAEFVEKKVKKGSKVIVFGRTETGSYTNKEGQRVFTTTVVIEEISIIGSSESINKVFLLGRLVADPEVRFTEGSTPLTVAKFRLAVGRRVSKNISDDVTTADFISCTAFGKKAECIEKYVRKGAKLLLTGRFRSGSYTNKEGLKVYTMDVIVDDFEFVESRKSEGNGVGGETSSIGCFGGVGGFVNIPDGFEEEYPFEH